MTNKSLTEPSKIMKEIGTLIDRSMLQIVNAMRHLELNKAGHNAIRRVDQLTRALEYLCDVEEYNKTIEAKLRGYIKETREQKQLIRELRKSYNPELEGFHGFFTTDFDHSFIDTNTSTWHDFTVEEEQ